MLRLIWLAGVFVIAAGLGFSSLPWDEWVQSFRVWIQQLGLIGFLAFSAVYVLAAVLLVPVWPLSISGGLAFGLWGFIWVPVSATLGAAAAFLISRSFAREKVREWLVTHPRFQAVDQAVGEEGWKVVVLLRVSPLVPYNLMNYFCGMSPVAFAPYLMATFVGSIPVTAMYVYLGFIGQAAAGGTLGWPQWTMLMVGLLATAAVTILITNKIRAKVDDPVPPKGAHTNRPEVPGGGGRSAFRH